MKTICPHCNLEYPEIDDSLIGKKAECAECGNLFVVKSVNINNKRKIFTLTAITLVLYLACFTIPVLLSVGVSMNIPSVEDETAVYMHKSNIVELERLVKKQEEKSIELENLCRKLDIISRRYPLGSYDRYTAETIIDEIQPYCGKYEIKITKEGFFRNKSAAIWEVKENSTKPIINTLSWLKRESEHLAKLYKKNPLLKTEYIREQMLVSLRNVIVFFAIIALVICVIALIIRKHIIKSAKNS